MNNGICACFTLMHSLEHYVYAIFIHVHVHGLLAGMVNAMVIASSSPVGGTGM